MGSTFKQRRSITLDAGSSNNGSAMKDKYEFKKQAKPTFTSDPTYGHVEHGQAARMPNCRCR